MKKKVLGYIYGVLWNYSLKMKHPVIEWGLKERWYKER